MNLNFMQSFISVALNHSYSVAAGEMWITQPAVTQQVRALEKELGFPLFIRSTRSVELTPEGEIFLKGAQEMINLYHRTLQECQKINQTPSTILLCYNGRYGYRLLPGIIKDFATIEPSCSVRVKRVVPANVIQMLMNRPRHLVITPYESVEAFPEIQFEYLYKDSLYCVMRQDHPLAHAKSISLEQLRSFPVLITPEKLNPPTVKRLNLQMYEGGVALSVAEHDAGDSLNTIIDNQMIRIACSDNISVMPLFSCPSDPSLVRIPYETNLTMDVVIAYHGELDPLEKRFVKCASKYGLKEMQKSLE